MEGSDRRFYFHGNLFLFPWFYGIGEKRQRVSETQSDNIIQKVTQ